MMMCFSCMIFCLPQSTLLEIAPGAVFKRSWISGVPSFQVSLSLVICFGRSMCKSRSDQMESSKFCGRKINPFRVF